MVALWAREAFNVREQYPTYTDIPVCDSTQSVSQQRRFDSF